LWTERFDRLLIVSTVFGAATCLIGTAINSQYELLPDGPFMILVGAALFFISFLFAPRGAIARIRQNRRFRQDLAAGHIGLIERKGSLPEELANLPDNVEVDGGPQLGRSPANSVKSSAVASIPFAGQTIRDVSTLLKPDANARPMLSWKIGFLLIVALAVAGVARWSLTLTPAQRPLAAWTIAIAALTNIPLAIFGCFLVLRRRSLLGDAISHSVLPGIAIALFISGRITGLPIGISAIVVGILTALLARWLKSFGRIPEDSSLGIISATLFAAGVLLFTRIAAKADIDPGCLLYGLLDSAALKQTHFLGFEVPSVVPTLAATCLYSFLFIGFLWKELNIATFDPALATAMGFSARLIDYVLLGFVAMAVVAAFESVGSILVVAMLIVPAATARLLTDRLGATVLWSIVMAVSSAVFGNIAAQEFNTSAAGMMAVVAGLQFVAAVFFAPEHGLVSKGLRKFSLAVRIAAEDILGMLYRAEEAVEHDQSLAAQISLADSQQNVRGLIGWLAIRQLLVHRLLEAAPSGTLELTDSGRTLARSIVRSHRLWETYLGEKAELPLDHLHAPAERMEHFIGPELQEQIAAELAVADVDPHGREIPTEDGWRRPVAMPSLPEVHRSVPVPRELTLTVLPSRAKVPVQMAVPHSASFWRTLLAFSGPGMMVSVGYMDPGNWATDLAGGAKFGYTLLSVILISNFMAMLLQYLSLKLGVVTGRDLAQACRDHYSSPVAIGLWLLCEVAIAACDLAEVIGSAIALNLLFGLPILVGVVLTAADVFVILFLQFKGFRYIEALVVALIGLITIC
ncbi:MAG TPA: Nramp family divalent metal transporter, partial [Pirellulales bacterium]